MMFTTKDSYSSQAEKLFKAETPLNQRRNIANECEQDAGIYPIILCTAVELRTNPFFQNTPHTSLFLGGTFTMSCLSMKLRQVLKLNPDESFFFFCKGKTLRFSRM